MLRTDILWLQEARGPGLTASAKNLDLNVLLFANVKENVL